MFGLTGLTVSRATMVAFLASRSSTVQHRSFAGSSTNKLAAMRYLLQYEYIPDVLEKRGPYRDGHLGLAKDLIAEGKCLSGGPTAPPGAEVPTGALFIFTNKASAEKFVAEDPYVANGIVTGHCILEWNVVVEKES